MRLLLIISQLCFDFWLMIELLNEQRFWGGLYSRGLSNPYSLRGIIFEGAFESLQYLEGLTEVRTKLWVFHFVLMIHKSFMAQIKCTNILIFFYIAKVSFLAGLDLGIKRLQIFLLLDKDSIKLTGWNFSFRALQQSLKIPNFDNLCLTGSSFSKLALNQDYRNILTKKR